MQYKPVTELYSHIEFLTDRWCESRNLEPLRLLLNAKASLNGLTDGWAEFRSNLKTIRARFSQDLPEGELNALISAICIADSALDRSDT